MNKLATSQYQPRLSSITKLFSRWISQSDCSIQITLNYYFMYKVQGSSVIYNNDAHPVTAYVKVNFLFTCRKRLHNRIISLRGEVPACTKPRKYTMYISYCICVLEICHCFYDFSIGF